MVSVKPNARIEKVEKLNDGEYRVWVRPPARDGRANEALVSVLADFFGRPKRAVKILKGLNARIKQIEILYAPIR